jgi:hypothetical protein
LGIGVLAGELEDLLDLDHLLFQLANYAVSAVGECFQLHQRDTEQVDAGRHGLAE